MANLFPVTQISHPGQALRVLREEAGLTAREVADRAGVSPAYLSRVENGNVFPSATWLSVIATAIAAALVESATRPTLATPSDTAVAS